MESEIEEKVGGSNLFVQPLDEVELDDKPDYCPNRLIIEDNVGEAIHLHYRNLRIEFSIDDFLKLSKNMQVALEELEDGDR